MADIFISYSKADHALALKLSAFLEAEGWSVWWDKSLAAADLCRDDLEIGIKVDRPRHRALRHWAWHSNDEHELR